MLRPRAPSPQPPDAAGRVYRCSTCWGRWTDEGEYHAHFAGAQHQHYRELHNLIDRLATGVPRPPPRPAGLTRIILAPPELADVHAMYRAFSRVPCSFRPSREARLQWVCRVLGWLLATFPPLLRARLAVPAAGGTAGIGLWRQRRPLAAVIGPWQQRRPLAAVIGPWQQRRPLAAGMASGSSAGRWRQGWPLAAAPAAGGMGDGPPTASATQPTEVAPFAQGTASSAPQSFPAPAAPSGGEPFASEASQAAAGAQGFPSQQVPQNGRKRQWRRRCGQARPRTLAR